MPIHSLPLELFDDILALCHPRWTEPPWHVQHDIEYLRQQEHLAELALVCRAWRILVTRALVRWPVLRLSSRKCSAFSELIFPLRLGGQLHPWDPLNTADDPPIHGMLLLFDASADVGQALLSSFLQTVSPHFTPISSLYVDNFPLGWDLVPLPPELHALGIRHIAPPTACPFDPWSHKTPLPSGLRRLSLCNLDLSRYNFARLSQSLVALSLVSCTFPITSPLAFGLAFPKLRTLFISCVAFPPPAFLAAFDVLPPQLERLTVHRLSFPTQLPDQRTNAAWTARWNVDVSLPGELTRHRPECLFTDSGRKLSPLALRHFASTKIWDAAHFFRSPEDARSAWQSDAAFVVSITRLVMLAYELGPMLADRLGVGAHEYGMGLWTPQRAGRALSEVADRRMPASATVTDYLSLVVGVPVRVTVEWSRGPPVRKTRAYVCLCPRPQGPSPLPTIPEVSEHSLKRLWRAVGEPLGEGPISVSVP